MTVNSRAVGGKQFGSRKRARLSTAHYSLLTFFITLVVYLLTLAPDLTWAHFGGDGGDLITAAVTLGTPHPMGYPTYTLLGWLWHWIPVGTVAWRFNFFSAACMAGAATMLVKSCQQVCDNSWQLGVSSGLLFAFSPLIWQQAIITEVYALNLFILSLLLWAILSRKSAFLIGLIWGVSLTTHLTSLLFAPLVFLGKYGLFEEQTDYRQLLIRLLPKSVMFSLAGAAIGLLPLLALPLLARGDSPVVWGDATTLEGWWWLVSGQVYRPNLLNHNPFLRIVNDPLRLLRQFAYIGWLPVLYGIWHTRRQTWLITATALLYFVYAYTYDTNDYYVFALPSLLLLSIPLAKGLTRFGWWSLALPMLALLLNFSSLSLHGDTAVRDRADQLWSQLPADSIALTQGDQTIFALWYFQEVEEIRPDIISVDANLLAFEWYRTRLQRLHPELLGLEMDDVGAFIQQNRGQRNVCFASIDPALSVQCQH